MALQWPEAILLFVFLLLMVGPEKLPKLARELGKAWNEFSSALSNEKILNHKPSEAEKALIRIAVKLGIDVKGKSIEKLENEISSIIFKKIINN